MTCKSTIRFSRRRFNHKFSIFWMKHDLAIKVNLIELLENFLGLRERRLVFLWDPLAGEGIQFHHPEMLRLATIDRPACVLLQFVIASISNATISRDELNNAMLFYVLRSAESSHDKGVPWASRPIK